MYWDGQKHPEFQISVKALIYNDQGALLLCKDEDNKWDLPGGRIDENESLHECVKREVQEELGVSTKSVSIRPLIAEVIKYDDNQNRMLVGFKVEVASLDFKSSAENLENKFVSKEEFEHFDQAYQGLKNIKHLLYD